jgi:DNA-binding transcriptional LysR family regulator
VRVGVSQDFTEVLLTGVFRHFLQQNEDVRLEVRTAETPELLNGFRDGNLDIVLTVASGDGDAAIVRRAETMWIGHSRLADEPELPLVLLDQPCPFRNAALRTLERSGKPYRIVVQTPHLLDLYAAVAGGLGVTCRTALFMLGNSTLAIRSSQLPHLPQIAYALYARSPGSPAVAWLDKMMRQAVTDMP